MNDPAIENPKGRKYPWSLSHKLARACWMVVWAVLGRIGPRQLSPLRVFLLRLFGARIGRGVLVCGDVRVLMPWNLEVGDYAILSESVDVYNFGKVTLGKHACLSRGVWVCTGSHDYNDPAFPLTWKDIAIGDYAWVAGECFLAPGVRVGDGAVVAARSVVTRHLEGWHVYGGNPCTAIKARPRLNQGRASAAADVAANAEA